MRIQRKRWVITRNNRKEIFCGLARNYQFKPVDDIGDTAIKTYLSKNKALSSYANSWRNPQFEVDAVEVVETIEMIKEETR